MPKEIGSNDQDKYALEKELLNSIPEGVVQEYLVDEDKFNSYAARLRIAAKQLGQKANIFYIGGGKAQIRWNTRQIQTEEVTTVLKGSQNSQDDIVIEDVPIDIPTKKPVGNNTEQQSIFFYQAETVSTVLGEPIMPPSLAKRLHELPMEEVERNYSFRMSLLARVVAGEGSMENISYEQHEQELNRLKVLNALDKYIEEYYQESEAPKVLRPVQIKAFEAIRNHLEQGETDGYIKLPTGIGKTVIFTEFLKAISGTGVKSLVAVPTQDLMRQTKGRFEEFGSEDLDVGMVYQYAREHGKEVTLITYASLIEGVKTGAIKPDEFDVFIGDEIHESLGKGAIPAVNKFKGGIRLGFTATPKYSENKQVSNLLNHEIYSMTVREAIESGLLSSVSVVIIKTNADLSNVSVKSNGEYNIDQLDEAINTAPRNKAAIRFYEQNLLGQVALARCNTVNHAANLARQFNESDEFKQAGLKAAYIHSKMDPDLRKELIRQHQAGEIHVLCHAGLLKRGYDNDKISAVFRMAPAHSIVDVEQEDGRGTRLDKNNPDKHLYVVEMRDENYAEDVNIVSYAQILNGTQVFPLNTYEPEADPDRFYYGGTRIVPIDVEGFEVVTNEQEILRLVKETQTISQAAETPLDTDFLLTQSFFQDIFVGNYSADRRLKLLAEKVIIRLRETYGDKFVFRKNGFLLSEVFTDRDLFIQEMVTAGAKLKNPDVQSPLDSDFALTLLSLDNTFKGRYSYDNSPIKTIADKVIDKLRENHPYKFTIRRSGSQSIEVFTDKDLFIQEMITAGAELKSSPLRESVETDFLLHRHSFENIFRGEYIEGASLHLIVNRVVSVLKQDFPDKFITVRIGTHSIETFADKDLFIQEMITAGAELKNLDLLPALESDFVLSGTSFMSNFIGSYEKDSRLKAIIDSVIAKFKKSNPEQFVTRIKGSMPVEVFTDRDSFIQEMIKAGAKLKNPDVQSPLDSDFILSQPSYLATFIGTYSRKGSPLRTIIDQVLSQLNRDYSHKFTTRRHGSQWVKTFTDRDLFVQEMVKAGAILRNPDKIS